MVQFAALLGAINVGGNRLSMADLRHALEREGFDAVETVIASGNVLFQHEDRPAAGIAEKIAHVVAERFDIDSFAVVLTREELAAAIAANPFREDGDASQVHAIFLEGELDSAAFDALVEHYADRGPERIAAGERALHVDYRAGVGRSKLTAPYIERQLGQRGTARNMRSLRRILDKMG
ncbi:DUF1697 domain-containing protein [Paraurantiacibacter namhicola]|uniref:DUF1697 domain-containing protein n=1 Tax=Paraurantiacibacter namhicola TaxID=645517 RepID=A0A1C7DAJ4_9SPHN|nr:DUF1697 domain-containing protein [Paraurantiacibacter namhicola]ANU08474.1 hypothetical protein A6F65_02189 [Paraurantiacibacter namhicola]